VSNTSAKPTPKLRDFLFAAAIGLLFITPRLTLELGLDELSSY
jgi:hypothetical protein